MPTKKSSSSRTAVESNIKTPESEYARAIQFAKSMNMQIWNVNDQSTKTSPTYTRFTKENILSYMQSPASNEKNLRNASIYMYDASSQYRRLVEYYAFILTWAFVVAPLNYDPSKVKEDSFRKQYLKVTSQLDMMNLKHELQKAALITYRDGILYGAIWSTNNSFYIQRINPDYCSLTSISDGTWQYSVDMSKIQESKLILYPPEFTTMYNTYRSGGQKWQEVPDNISFCLKADETNPNYSVPPWCSTLPMLYDLETYKALQETATKLSNYKMLSMKIPLNPDGTPQLDWDLAEEYYKQLVKQLPPYVGAAISPMQLDSFNFEKASGTQDVDTVARAEQQYWFDTGTSALLHGSNVANTAGALKMSVTSDEEIAFGLMTQAERLINRFLKAMPGTVKFKIQFLPITVYNYADKVKMYREAASLGIPGSKAAYAAAIEMHQTDLSGYQFIESSLLGCADWEPLNSSFTKSAPSDKQSGRPQKDDSDLGDAGEKTRESDSDANKV